MRGLTAATTYRIFLRGWGKFTWTQRSGRLESVPRYSSSAKPSGVALGSLRDSGSVSDGWGTHSQHIWVLGLSLTAWFTQAVSLHIHCALLWPNQQAVCVHVCVCVCVWYKSMIHVHMYMYNRLLMFRENIYLHGDKWLQVSLVALIGISDYG